MTMIGTFLASIGTDASKQALGTITKRTWTYLRRRRIVADRESMIVRIGKIIRSSPTNGPLWVSAGFLDKVEPMMAQILGSDGPGRDRHVESLNNRATAGPDSSYRMVPRRLRRREARPVRGGVKPVRFGAA